MESNPCAKIISLIEQKTEPELIYQFIVCDYGINKVCRVYSLKMGKLQTILDELLFHLDSYHEYDTVDDKFYDIATIVLLMINNKAKCAGELSYSSLIADYNQDYTYASNLDTNLVPETGVDYHEYIFKCLSVDMLRFDYLNLLKQTNKPYLNTNLYRLINIMVVDRNYSDAYSPRHIAEKYQQIIGINSINCNNMTLIQSLIYENNLSMLYQINEGHLLYKRINALIVELKKLD
jgi:hypothetical protein